MNTTYKLGPRQTKRKQKGRKKPVATRQAKARRAALLRSLAVSQ